VGDTERHGGDGDAAGWIVVRGWELEAVSILIVSFETGCQPTAREGSSGLATRIAVCFRISSIFYSRMEIS
jgi:hypothetical protein